MNEVVVGKLWLKEDGTEKYLGGAVLHDVTAGAHVRLRKNRQKRVQRDGDYLLVLVEEKPKDKPKRGRRKKPEEPLPPENDWIYSFIPPPTDEVGPA